MPKQCFNLSWINAPKYQEHVRRVWEIIRAYFRDALQGMLVFRSLAKGTAQYNSEHQSDIDLLVIAQSLPPHPLARAKQDWKILGVEGLGVHCIWETPEELEDLVNRHQAFTFEILRDGQIIYDPWGILNRFKGTVQDLIVQLGIVETKHAWVWPQKVPGSLIEW